MESLPPMTLPDALELYEKIRGLQGDVFILLDPREHYSMMRTLATALVITGDQLVDAEAAILDLTEINEQMRLLLLHYTETRPDLEAPAHDRTYTNGTGGLVALGTMDADGHVTWTNPDEGIVFETWMIVDEHGEPMMSGRFAPPAPHTTFVGTAPINLTTTDGRQVIDPEIPTDPVPVFSTQGIEIGATDSITIIDGVVQITGHIDYYAPDDDTYLGFDVHGGDVTFDDAAETSTCTGGVIGAVWIENYPAWATQQPIVWPHHSAVVDTEHVTEAGGTGGGSVVDFGHEHVTGVHWQGSSTGYFDNMEAINHELANEIAANFGRDQFTAPIDTLADAVRHCTVHTDVVLSDDLFGHATYCWKCHAIPDSEGGEP